jgi:hypothetical protein
VKFERQLAFGFGEKRRKGKYRIGNCRKMSKRKIEKVKTSNRKNRKRKKSKARRRGYRHLFFFWDLFIHRGFIDGISVSAHPHYLALSPQHSGYVRFISKCMRVY